MKTSRSVRPAPGGVRLARLRRTSIFTAFLFAGAMTLSGCGILRAKEDAQATLETHFQAVAAHSSADVLSRYDESFFQSVPREEWAKRLATLETKLGEYRSFETVSWNVNSKMGTDSGTYVSVTCKVTYAKHTAQEAFVLFRKQDDEPFRILRHGINSDALLAQ